MEHRRSVKAPPRRIRRQRSGRALGLVLGVVIAAGLVILRHSGEPLLQGGGGVTLTTLLDRIPVGLPSGINLDALDGTAGWQGPRRWNDTAEQRAQSRPFEDTTAQLSSQERDSYRKWVAWSEKPPGQDYVQPSVEYFSLGKTKPFKGDAHQPGVLKAMLEARSYKTEIIVFLMAGTRTVEIGLNLIFNMRDLGYDHWTVFADDEADCDRLEAAVGNAGCVWTSIFDVEDAPALVREPAAKSNPIFFWIKRWLHVARIVRLGYNVCNIDTDVVIHDDMYKHLKGPLFGNLTWICGDDDYQIACNGGFNYIQHAAPDGGAAWMAGMMTDYTLRIIERPQEFESDAQTQGRPWHYAAFDQNMLISLVASATLGVVVMPHWYKDVDADLIAQAERERPWEHHDGDNMLPMPLEWQDRLGSTEIGARWHEIRVPQRRGTPVLDAPRKPFSQRYRDLLASESGAPMWPEESQLEAASRPEPQRKEYLGKALDFIVQNWKTGMMCGRWWGQKPPRGVVGHIVLIPGAFVRSLFFKVNGWWHWKVEQLAVDHYGREGFYPVWPAAQQAPPKILAYAPALEFQGVSRDEWRAVVTNLVTAATLLGRVLVWPLLPCGTEWLVDSGAPPNHGFVGWMFACTFPKNCHCGVDDHWYGTRWDRQNAVPILDENYPLARKACLHWHQYDEQCNAIQYPDFKHMLRRLPADAAAATPRSTLFAGRLSEPQRAAFVQLTAAELRSQVDALQGDQTVVYLGAVPHLAAEAASAADANLQTAHQQCSQPWLGMHGPDFEAFVADRLPSIGAAVIEV